MASEIFTLPCGSSHARVRGLSASNFLSTSRLNPMAALLAPTARCRRIGGVMTVLGISDYLGRGQYRRRIDELEQRRAFLRQRMYEAYVS